MKRSKFIASFFAILGVSKAQSEKPNPTPDGLGTPQWKYCAVPGNEPSKLGEPPWYCGTTPFKSARPNQCPTCGTMAEKYTRPRGLPTVESCSAPLGSEYACSLPGKPYGPIERLTRCKRCNAAFFQDAEGE